MYVTKYSCNIGDQTLNAICNFFTVAPEIEDMGKKMIFTKGMLINCTVTKGNPPEINYTWHSCNTRKCDDKSWKPKAKSSSFRLDSLPKSGMTYRCTAKNAAGSDTEELKVYRIESKKLTELQEYNQSPLSKFFSV